MIVRRAASLIAVGLAFVAIGGLATDLPVVFQPLEWSAETGADLAVYVGELRRLEAILADGTYASQRIHAASGSNAWRAERFCPYVQGLLVSRGYEVLIVESDRTGGEPSAWLLVKIELPTGFAWAPVDPTPPPGERQDRLGRIALATGRTLDDPAFDLLYMTFDRTVELPPNRPPSVRLLGRPFPARATRKERFNPATATDPDGEIVLYVWEFGDGTVVRSTARSTWHRFTSAGEYTITVTVVDDRGATASASILLVVEHGCGC